MTRKNSPREIVRDMLRHWAEWDSEGLYAAKSQRSMLGRIGESRAPTGSRPLPPGVWIPADVQEIRRLLLLMRDNCRAGHRYYRAVYAHYVNQEDRVPSVDRAEKWLVDAWLSMK
jgi:hypothetical protein